MKQADEQETATNKQVQQERTRVAGTLKEERRDRQGRPLLRRISDPDKRIAQSTRHSSEKKQRKSRKTSLKSWRHTSTLTLITEHNSHSLHLKPYEKIYIAGGLSFVHRDGAPERSRV